MSVKRVCDGCGEEFEHGDEYVEVMVEGPQFQIQDFHVRCRALGGIVPGELVGGELGEEVKKITIARKKWY